MKIKKSIVERLIHHGKNEAPLEACGYLASKEGMIVASYELTNVDQSPEHFSFDPKEQFAAMKKSRADGLEIRAVYHTHPASPARPSAEDIKLAYDPGILYVIVSLAGEKPDLKAFTIKNQRAEPASLEVASDENL